MKLINADYGEFAGNIIKNNNRIVVYGAGMIGQIVVPYIINTYGLHDYMECYVDVDKRKVGKEIAIGSCEYEIKTLDTLYDRVENMVILLTNSKFYPIVKFLDQMEELINVDCYIVPIMQLIQADNEEEGYDSMYLANTSETLAKMEPTIPKKIHYCWFGGKKMPEFLVECMESWQMLCPEYEIVRWDENNYDVDQHEYTRQAATHKKWGFVTDVARLDILYKYGGIYMDTDVKLLKSFDGLLHQKGFVGVERWGNINTGGSVGAIPHHPMIREMLDERLKHSFTFNDGSYNTETNGLYETIPFLRYGMRIDNTLQIINGMTVYPASVFHPYDYMSCQKKVKRHTVSIHYFLGGWMEKEDRENRENTQHQYVEIMQRMEE